MTITIPLAAFQLGIVALIDAGKHLHLNLSVSFFFSKFLQSGHLASPEDIMANIPIENRVILTYNAEKGVIKWLNFVWTAGTKSTTQTILAKDLY